MPFEIGIGIGPTFAQPRGFAPGDIGLSNIKLWLDATDPATLFTDAAMTTRISAQDQPVMGWADKSPSLLAHTNAVSGDSPLFKSDRTLFFNGTSHALASDVLTGLPLNTATSEVFILCKQAALVADTTTRYAYAYGGAAASNSRRYGRSVISAANRGHALATSVTVTDITVDLSSVHVIHVINTSTAIDIDVDNDSPVTAAVSTNTTSLRSRVGALHATTPSNWWSGKIGAIIVTNALSAAQRTPLKQFLLDRRSLIT